MKFLCISDIHGNTEVLDKLDDVFKSVDAVLFAGDFAECFKTETAKPVLDKLVNKHDEIYAVLGNCDEPDFIEELEDEGINAERILNYSSGFAIIGSGGGSKFTGKTPNERELEDLQSDFAILDSCEEENGDGKWNNLICISHNPPKDTKCDAVNQDLHAGSALFREFIEKKEPLAVVTGHIHEGAGIDRIGNTLVVNPGSLGEKGTYAILVADKNGLEYNVSCELKSI